MLGEETPHPPAPITEIGRFGPGREVLSNVLIRTRTGGPTWSLARRRRFMGGVLSEILPISTRYAASRRSRIPVSFRCPGPVSHPSGTSKGGGLGLLRPNAIPDAFRRPFPDDGCPIEVFPNGRGPVHISCSGRQSASFCSDSSLPLIPADAPDLQSVLIPAEAIAGSSRGPMPGWATDRTFLYRRLI